MSGPYGCDCDCCRTGQEDRLRDAAKYREERAAHSTEAAMLREELAAEVRAHAAHHENENAEVSRLRAELEEARGRVRELEEMYQCVYCQKTAATEARVELLEGLLRVLADQDGECGLCGWSVRACDGQFGIDGRKPPAACKGREARRALAIPTEGGAETGGAPAEERRTQEGAPKCSDCDGKGYLYVVGSEASPACPTCAGSHPETEESE